MASPSYSTTWCVAPAEVSCAIRPRIRSFAATPRPGCAGERHAQRVRALLRQRLRGQHVLDLARADAERERAEGAVRRGVRVAAHDRHAGLRDAQLGADHVDDALAPVPHAVVRDAELLDVARERVELLARDVVLDRAREVPRRHVVVGRRDRAIGPPHRAPGEPQTLERLRARDLVDEVQVDVEQVAAEGVVVPDLLVGGACAHAGSLARRCCSTGRLRTSPAPVGRSAPRSRASSASRARASSPATSTCERRRGVCAELRDAGHDARAVRHDVTSRAQTAEAALAAVLDAHGRVDIACANAGHRLQRAGARARRRDLGARARGQHDRRAADAAGLRLADGRAALGRARRHGLDLVAARRALDGRLLRVEVRGHGPRRVAREGGRRVRRARELRQSRARSRAGWPAR